MASPPRKTDDVYLRNLSLHLPVGPDAWHRKGKPQPVLVSVRISFHYPDGKTPVAAAAAKDDVGKALDYGKLRKKIFEMTSEEDSYSSVSQLSSTLLFCAVRLLEERRDSDPESASHKYHAMTDVEIWLPKGVLRADGGLRYRCRYREDQIRPKILESVEEEEVWIEGIKCSCTVGVNPHERIEKQIVVVKLGFESYKRNGLDPILGCYQEVTHKVIERVEASSYQTIEALATFIARIVTMDFDIDAVTVSVEKPSALAFVEGAGVEITRDKAFFSNNDFWRTGAAAGSTATGMEED